MEIYTRYGPALLRKATRLLGDRDDALDVVQALFTDLCQKGQTEVELPYLYRATTHRCLTMLRDRHNRRRLLARESHAMRGVVRTRLDEAVIGSDLLAKLLDRLDPETLEVLVYRYWDDMDQTEIASMVGASRKTIGRRMARIRGAVVELIEIESTASHPTTATDSGER